MQDPNIDPTAWADPDDDPPMESYRPAVLWVLAVAAVVVAVVWALA